MQAMIDFCISFFSELPAFLMAEPVVYLVALGVMASVATLVRRMIQI